ncbi:MAG: CBS domain-containing protein [Bacillota bacterium]
MVSAIRLSKRQAEILELVKAKGPITGEEIGAHFNLTRATLRPDLAILTMSGLLDARPRVGYFYPGPKSRSFVGEQLETIMVKKVKALPVVIQQGLSAYDAAVTLFLEDCSTLFVVDAQGHLQGVLTSKDLLKAAVGKADLQTIPVEMVMTRFPQLVWVDEGAPVTEALAKLNQSQVACLPVLKDGKLATGRFDMGIVLKLLDEVANGYFEEGGIL